MDRRAWHRPAAALGPDETVAAELDDAASRAERRAAISVAVTALERAVELSVDPVARNSRLLRAAQLSFELGWPALVDGFVRDVDRTGLNLAERARLALLQQYVARQSGPPGRQSRTLLPVERDWASPPAPPAGAAEDMSEARPDSPLIGRSGELSRLQAMIGREDGGALVVLGEAGIGKSALLADLAGYAAARGLRVLSAAGRERESSLALAGLRQLLRPVLVELLTLPGPHAEELRAALSLTSVPPAFDPLLTSTALLEPLAGPPDGVLVLVDNAQWMDGASLDVLALSARRRAAGAVTMIFAARGDVPPPGLDQGIPELRPGPLSAVDAGALLAAQPHPPPGRARAQILAQAAGNPLALIELARAIAADPAAGRGWGGLPLPLTGRLRTVFAAQLGILPAETRHALLSVAVADGDVRVPGPDPEVLAPAEELGLITVDTSEVRFRHPLIRSAVYHDAPFASRAAAHRRLAEMPLDRPDRRAWHLAAASLLPDEDIASVLAATSSAIEQRGGAVTVALSLERAADLSPEPADQARRLVAAAEAAVRAGQTEWAAELAARAWG